MAVSHRWCLNRVIRSYKNVPIVTDVERVHHHSTPRSSRSSKLLQRVGTPALTVVTVLASTVFGLARPADKDKYGYLSEHHSYGETAKKAGDYAEDLAATMLGTTLGIDFDPEKAWSEREQVFRLEKTILKTRNIVQSAEGHPKGTWSTVIACGVFIF